MRKLLLILIGVLLFAAKFTYKLPTTTTPSFLKPVAVHNTFGAPRKNKKKPPCVLVKSSGGVGSSAIFNLLHELGIPTNDPHDQDRLKHATFAETLAQVRSIDTERGKRRRGWEALSRSECRGGFERAIYVFGDPVHAVWSLLRRGLANEMQKRTRSQALPPDSRLFNFLAPCLKKQRLLRRSFTCQSPEKYVAAGKDLLELEAHFDGWWDGAHKLYGDDGPMTFAPDGQPFLPGGVLFTRSTSMHKHLDELLEFLAPSSDGKDYVHVRGNDKPGNERKQGGIENARAPGLFLTQDSPWRYPFTGEKSTDKSAANIPVANRLARLYRGLIDKQAKIGDFEIIRQKPLTTDARVGKG